MTTTTAPCTPTPTPTPNPNHTTARRSYHPSAQQTQMKKAKRLAALHTALPIKANLLVFGHVQTAAPPSLALKTHNSRLQWSAKANHCQMSWQERACSDLACLPASMVRHSSVNALQHIPCAAGLTGCKTGLRKLVRTPPLPLLLVVSGSMQRDAAPPARLQVPTGACGGQAHAPPRFARRGLPAC
jgi:hypothetical protein